MKKTLLLSVLILLFVGTGFSQTFLVPCKDFANLMNQKAYVIKLDGSKVEGTVRGGSLVMGYLKKVVLRDESGVKYKFKADELKSFCVKPSKFAKFMMATDVDFSMKNIEDGQQVKTLNREYVVFETNKKHTKKGKSALMQLLNFGFDSKLKVYQDPNASKTSSFSLGGLTLAGGIEKSYVVVKKGCDKAIKILKRKYNKQFSELFGAKSDAILKQLGKKKIDWKDFPLHVFIYENIK